MRSSLQKHTEGCPGTSEVEETPHAVLVEKFPEKIYIVACRIDGNWALMQGFGIFTDHDRAELLRGTLYGEYPSQVLTYTFEG